MQIGQAIPATSDTIAVGMNASGVGPTDIEQFSHDMSKSVKSKIPADAHSRASPGVSMTNMSKNCTSTGYQVDVS